MFNEVKSLEQLQTIFEGLAINADIELAIDNSKVVNRIFQYKKMQDLLSDLIFEMNDQYRDELDAHIEKHQTEYR